MTRFFLNWNCCFGKILKEIFGKKRGQFKMLEFFKRDDQKHKLLAVSL